MRRYGEREKRKEMRRESKGWRKERECERNKETESDS